MAASGARSHAGRLPWAGEFESSPVVARQSLSLGQRYVRVGDPRKATGTGERFSLGRGGVQRRYVPSKENWMFEKWARANGCPRDSQTLSKRCANGSLGRVDIRFTSRANGCRKTNNLATVAASLSAVEFSRPGFNRQGSSQRKMPFPRCRFGQKAMVVTMRGAGYSHRTTHHTVGNFAMGCT